jgi:hypothetical protein
MTEQARRPARILWANVVTVLSAAVLIGTVIVGTGFATGWAIAGMLGLEEVGTTIVEALFVAAATAVVIAFVRYAMRIEPFVER